MLANLHVKNFAIIDEIDVDFGQHLNIMTGETGAGKSILVGSISIALGARVSSEIIGKNGDYAMVEVVFQLEKEDTLDKIRRMGIEIEDGQVVISRKITGNRSINKINGESVSVGVIRKVAALCIDIHGQHEHQSLLNKEKHKQIVDDFGGNPLREQKEKVAEQYQIYLKLKKEIEQDSLSSEERARQLDFLKYEKKEIEEAALMPGEETEIETRYRRAANAVSIVEVFNEVYKMTDEQAAAAVSHGIRGLSSISDLDNHIENFSEELLQIESLLLDFNREVSEFISEFTFNENEMLEIEQRMNCIRTLQTKYGESYEDIMNHLKAVNEKLDKYADYENYCQKRQIQYEQAVSKLQELSDTLSGLRKKSAKKLEQKISVALQDLNFAHVDFEIKITKKDEFYAEGQDEIEFLIASNPGEPRLSLAKVASGGELSRIMLAIKSVFADSDEIETLIFDEIDAGISGRTAQKVSEKMSLLGNHHQVICITHLAQIAAMADYHFVIEKKVEKERSVTRIRQLERNEMEEELARILGGVQVTEAVLTNAHEMKELAECLKKYNLS